MFYFNILQSIHFAYTRQIFQGICFKLKLFGYLTAYCFDLKIKTAWIFSFFSLSLFHSTFIFRFLEPYGLWQMKQSTKRHKAKKTKNRANRNIARKKRKEIREPPLIWLISNIKYKTSTRNKKVWGRISLAKFTNFALFKALVEGKIRMLESKLRNKKKRRRKITYKKINTISMVFFFIFFFFLKRAINIISI